MADDEDKRMPSWGDGVRPFNGETYPPGMSYGFLEDYQMSMGAHQMHPVHSMVPNQPPNGGHVAPEDNFTVLSMGHGSYLRLYHNNKDEASKFNNYELFSGNTLPNPAFQAAPGMSRSTDVGQKDASYTTNMFLNQLVGNWAPNVSGTYTPFGEVVDQVDEATAATHHRMAVSQRAPEAVSGPETMAKPFEINRPAPLTENGQSVHTRDAKKPRMVAEVKPMRMTYSDVLSKNVAISTATSAATNTPPPATKTPQSDKGKSSEKKTHGQEEKVLGKAKKNATSTPPPVRGEDRAQATHQATAAKDTASQSASDDSHSKEPKKEVKTAKKKTAKNGQKSNKPNGNRKPKNSKYNHLSDNNEEDEIDDEDANDETDEMGFFYNVAQTSNGNDVTFTEKSSKTVLMSTKSRSRNSASASRTSSNRNRGENTAMYSSRRNTRQKKNDKYVFLMRLLELWLDYLLKAVLWLVSLVTDIVWLSYGIVWDKMCSSYSFVRQHYKTVCKEVRNSANLHRRFLTFVDRKFSKNSKWAFWRRLFRRQPPIEAAGLGAAGGNQEFYKNGRLPQTGEEAMYSLLNCKGKDAYSILGVSQDCSQEQIRKHYKKIAVLVHPDKNKQPGAEEAFKVLQRAFELIGEPENRQAYERNLAEALNAEKAWTELNDLLTQLHAKIAEAANTIRCSSCGLRHPRKPTGRPHYAARECNSCKIRHSAREGDIWAETTFMGICWKYLALMEGNVYDITEWANCQKGALSHLQPNSHSVQYRIVLGNQQQQQQQQQTGGSGVDKKEAKKDSQFSRPSLDDFLTNLYGGSNQQSQFSSKRRTKKN